MQKNKIYHYSVLFFTNNFLITEYLFKHTEDDHL